MRPQEGEMPGHSSLLAWPDDGDFWGTSWQSREGNLTKSLGWVIGWMTYLLSNALDFRGGWFWRRKSPNIHGAQVLGEAAGSLGGYPTEEPLGAAQLLVFYG